MRAVLEENVIRIECVPAIFFAAQNRTVESTITFQT
jgi:hypothetical protein